MIDPFVRSSPSTIAKARLALKDVCLLHMCGPLENGVHALDVAKNVASTASDVGISVRNARKGLEDREDILRMPDCIPRPGAGLILDAGPYLAEHLLDVTSATGTRFDLDVECLRTIRAIFTGHPHALMRSD